MGLNCQTVFLPALDGAHYTLTFLKMILVTIFQLFRELTIFNMSLTRYCAKTRINESLHNSLRIDGYAIFFPLYLYFFLLNLIL